MQPETLPQFFLQKVRKYGDEKVALRQKEFGIWQEYSWQASYENVHDFSLGLLALGFERGEKVCTIGDNDRQYLWGYIGLLCLGGVQVGVYTDAIASELQYIASHSDATFALAKDQEQCDKFLEIRDSVPGIRHVIYWDDKGLWNYHDEWLISFAEVQERGRQLAARDPDRFEREIGLGKATDISVICYTSGTTGLPKGAMLTHGNLLQNAALYHAVDPRFDTDNHVSMLPMGWIGEHALGIAPHLYTGIIMNFPEEPETVRENVREIAPEGILYNSRLWESLVGLVQVRISESTWLNRKLFAWCMPIGYQVADKRIRGEPISPWLRLGYSLADLAVFQPLRDKLGLTRLRAAYTAGAALSPDVIRFFHAMGIELRQIYGSTEVTGGLTVHYPNDIKFASVGKPIPEAKVHIAENGEILLTGPTLFVGYYKNPEETEAALWTDPAGDRWFRTGDAGFVDEDGHVIYLDRVNDMITLANGEQFSPQFIEGRLKFNPHIRDVMAIGGPTRSFATALVVIDFANVGNWAERNGIGYTTFLDLAQKPEVIALVQKAVNEVNGALPETARVRRFVLMHKEFDADEAEMTRSRKLRRNVLFDRYSDIVDAMYAGDEAVTVTATVRYQDGSEAAIASTIRIADAA